LQLEIPDTLRLVVEAKVRSLPVNVPNAVTSDMVQREIFELGSELVPENISLRSSVPTRNGTALERKMACQRTPSLPLALANSVGRMHPAATLRRRTISIAHSGLICHPES
jgi:hypothetical protein